MTRKVRDIDARSVLSSLLVSLGKWNLGEIHATRNANLSGGR
jgi:hypothetical protein